MRLQIRSSIHCKRKNKDQTAMEVLRSTMARYSGNGSNKSLKTRREMLNAEVASIKEFRRSIKCILNSLEMIKAASTQYGIAWQQVRMSLLFNTPSNTLPDNRRHRSFDDSKPFLPR